MQAMEETFRDIVGKGEERCIHRVMDQSAVEELEALLDSDSWLKPSSVQAASTSGCKRDCNDLMEAVGTKRYKSATPERGWRHDLLITTRMFTHIVNPWREVSEATDVVLFRLLRRHPKILEYRAFLQQVIQPARILSFISSAPPSTSIAHFLRHSHEIYRAFQSARQSSFIVPISSFASSAGTAIVALDNMLLDYANTRQFIPFPCLQQRQGLTSMSKSGSHGSIPVPVPPNRRFCNPQTPDGRLNPSIDFLRRRASPPLPHHA